MGGSPLIVLFLLAAITPRETVRVMLPERSPCALDAVEGALRARLPGALVRSGEAQPGDVSLRLTPVGGEWSLELEAPGQRPLTRRLAAPDCLGLSAAAALIAERYLESIDWTAAPGEVQALPPPAPAPRWEGTLGLGVGLGLGGLGGLAPVAQLELGARLDGWLLEVWASYLGSGLVALEPSTRPAFLFHHGGAVALTAGRRLALGPGAVRLALAPAVALSWVGASAQAPGAPPDPLPHRQTAFAALPSVALQAGYELQLRSPVSIGLRLQARLHLGTASFSAEGYTPTLATHLVEGEACLTVGYRFF